MKGYSRELRFPSQNFRPIRELRNHTEQVLHFVDGASGVPKSEVINPCSQRLFIIITESSYFRSTRYRDYANTSLVLPKVPTRTRCCFATTLTLGNWLIQPFCFKTGELSKVGKSKTRISLFAQDSSFKILQTWL